MKGNVFCRRNEFVEYAEETVTGPDAGPGIHLIEGQDGYYLEIRGDCLDLPGRQRELVTGAILGLAETTGLPYERRDGDQYFLDTDYLGRKREVGNPAPGPFAHLDAEGFKAKVWPVAGSGEMPDR